jgi:hypothetical protein
MRSDCRRGRIAVVGLQEGAQALGSGLEVHFEEARHEVLGALQAGSVAQLRRALQGRQRILVGAGFLEVAGELQDVERQRAAAPAGRAGLGVASAAQAPAREGGEGGARAARPSSDDARRIGAARSDATA